MQHGCVDVGNKVSFAESVVAEFVGGAVDVAALEAGARHPDRAAIG